MNVFWMGCWLDLRAPKRLNSLTAATQQDAARPRPVPRPRRTGPCGPRVPQGAEEEKGQRPADGDGPSVSPGATEVGMGLTVGHSLEAGRVDLPWWTFELRNRFPLHVGEASSSTIASSHSVRHQLPKTPELGGISGKSCRAPCCSARALLQVPGPLPGPSVPMWSRPLCICVPTATVGSSQAPTGTSQLSCCRSWHGHP